MPTEISPIVVICSIRLVRFWAERKRSFLDLEDDRDQDQAEHHPDRGEVALDHPADHLARVDGFSSARRLRRGRSGRALMLSLPRAAVGGFRLSSATRLRAGLSPMPVIAATTCSSVASLGAEVARRAAEAKDEDAVGDLEDVDQVVADHDDAEVALAQAFDQRQDLWWSGHAERRGRLVEQHHLRLAEQRAGDRHLLALAAGERADLAAEARDRHREVGEQLRRAVLHRDLVELAR